MKSDIISIRNEVQQTDIERVLKEVEKLAKYKELDEKQTLHLRLLAEELIGFQKGILGFCEGNLYIENEGNEYKICLHADVKMDILAKDRAVEFATDHINSAYLGFKGKLRMIMDTMFQESEIRTGVDEYRGFLLNDINDFNFDDYDKAWSLNEYKNSIEEDSSDWDMLEHSILANIADDIIVAARNNYVDIIVSKKF